MNNIRNHKAFLTFEQINLLTINPFKKVRLQRHNSFDRKLVKIDTYLSPINSLAGRSLNLIRPKILLREKKPVIFEFLWCYTSITYLGTNSTSSSNVVSIKSTKLMFISTSLPSG